MVPFLKYLKTKNELQPINCIISIYHQSIRKWLRFNQLFFPQQKKTHITNVMKKKNVLLWFLLLMNEKKMSSLIHYYTKQHKNIHTQTPYRKKNIENVSLPLNSYFITYCEMLYCAEQTKCKFELNSQT